MKDKQRKFFPSLEQSMFTFLGLDELKEHREEKDRADALRNIDPNNRAQRQQCKKLLSTILGEVARMAILKNKGVRYISQIQWEDLHAIRRETKDLIEELGETAQQFKNLELIVNLSPKAAIGTYLECYAELCKAELAEMIAYVFDDTACQH